MGVRLSNRTLKPEVVEKQDFGLAFQLHGSLWGEFACCGTNKQATAHCCRDPYLVASSTLMPKTRCQEFVCGGWMQRYAGLADEGGKNPKDGILRAARARRMARWRRRWRTRVDISRSLH